MVDKKDDQPKESTHTQTDSSSDDIAKLKKLQAPSDSSSSCTTKHLEAKHTRLTCNDKASIVIKNIDKSVTEVDIRKWLKGCGKIKQVHIPRNKKGLYTNYVYVEFCNVKDVEIALSMSGASLMNKKVFVFRKKGMMKRG